MKLIRNRSETEIERKDFEASVPEALREYLLDPQVKEAFDARVELVLLGGIIRSLREANGMTQARLADDVGTTQSEIARLEKGMGKHGPSYGMLQRLARSLNAELTITSRTMKPTETSVRGARSSSKRTLAADIKSHI